MTRSSFVAEVTFKEQKTGNVIKFQPTSKVMHIFDIQLRSRNELLLLV